MSHPTIYLASGSPRRRELLTNLGFQVIQLSASINETPYPQESARVYVSRMAAEKNQAAVAFWYAHQPQPPQHPILTADTTVALNSQILGKPESDADARRILNLLSGQTHQVLTSVAIYFQKRSHHLTQISHVRFKTLSAAEINAYIAHGEPRDKAGAYGIQGVGGMFVEHLSGSFTGVMGLPIFETVQLIQSCGYPVPPFATVDKFGDN